MRNAAVQYSLKHGKKQKVGDRLYVGDLPVYGNFQKDPILPADWRKVKKGIPFVRA